ncbi:MAG TPA: biopolymer transporter ExbD [Bacillota bacterium]|nr:biopolymer transporter ExbD [Bacillota bacterium]
MDLRIKRKRSRIEIVPMIDIMFFMLVFFMLFSTLKTTQTGIRVELPKTLHLGQTAQNTVVISITKDNNLFFGKDPVAVDLLTGRVQQELQTDTSTVFVVKPDITVSYGELVKVMDALAGAGVERPLLGVERKIDTK